MKTTVPPPAPPAPVPSGQPFELLPQYRGLSHFNWFIQAVNIPPAPAPAGITLRAAIDEVLIAKTTACLRPRSIHVLRSILNNFAKGREAVPLASIGVKEIESWLAGQKIKPSTKQSSVGRLSALFSYHIRRDNLAANPCRKLERIRVEHTAPVILSPEQAAKLLALSPAHLRPYVILGMFAGIRPEEILRLTWEDVCLDTRTVRVNLAKTRRRRIVPLEPCAVALLKKCRRKKGRIAPSNSTVRRGKRILAKRLGFPNWPADLLRHTAASYLLALLGDAGKVAARLGNSSAVLLTHYHQPVKQAACDKFWQLTTVPPAPRRRAYSKYDKAAVLAFYGQCKSYKETRAKFGISCAGLHYLIRKKRAARTRASGKKPANAKTTTANAS